MLYRRINAERVDLPVRLREIFRIIVDNWKEQSSVIKLGQLKERGKHTVCARTRSTSRALKRRARPITLESQTVSMLTCHASDKEKRLTQKVRSKIIICALKCDA